MRRILMILVILVATGFIFAQKVDDGVVHPARVPYNATISRATDTCDPQPTPIPDNDPAGVSSTITVVEDELIEDISIRVDIAHTWVGDLIITVEHNGTTAMLLERAGLATPTGCCGCSGNDISATFTDSAAIPAEDVCDAAVPTINGSFLPVDSLVTAFGGMSTVGDWTITVSDGAGGDTGEIMEWCVATTEAAAASSVPTMGQWGLIVFVTLIIGAGLVFMRKNR